MNPRQYSSTNPKIYLGLAALGVATILVFWKRLLEFADEPIRLACDRYDLGVYFRSSRWAAGEGILYQDVSSEYPPFANLLYGLCRLISERLPGFEEPRHAFDVVWICMGWLAFVFATYLVLNRAAISKTACLTWLAPPTLYFSLYRFDIYPALATILAFLALKNCQFRWASLWIGLAIAWKGYCLFLLPSLFVYVVARKGWRSALECSLLCLAPFVLGNLVVYCYAGWNGMLSPYLFHADRNLNGQSTFDGLFLENLILAAPFLPKALQILCSLAPALARPDTFQKFVDASLISLVGFVSFSVFYSPQFCLWIVAVALFSDRKPTIILATLFSWLSYLYFPIAFDLAHPNLQEPFFQTVITVLSLLRLAILGSAVRSLLSTAPDCNSSATPQP